MRARIREAIDELVDPVVSERHWQRELVLGLVVVAAVFLFVLLCMVALATSPVGPIA